MCGFAGEFLFPDAKGRADLARAERMAAALAHRGPDDAAAWVSPDGRCAIGFRRLAVIDPSGSRQPLAGPDGRLAVACNGEIYNYRALREALASGGASFATAGDVEALLHLYRRDGLGMLQGVRGMFALALYDASAARLVLARDRLGEKPLYYALLGDRIVFGSEVKALLRHELVGRQMDRESINLYISMGYIPAPATAYRAIRRLEPGSLLAAGPEVRITRYWQPRVAPAGGAAGDALDRVRQTLRQSVGQCLVSDVPLGALLSGGLDSSILVALMAQAAGGPNVRTFTAGFDDPRFDERPFARRVAEHCGTRHTELPIRPASAVEMLDRLVETYDQPFGDSSALPMMLICQAAREHVTVALTGDGGDEVFAGYDRYRAMNLSSRMHVSKYLLYRMLGIFCGSFASKDERNFSARFMRFADNLPYPPAVQYFNYRCLFRPDELPRLLHDEFLDGIDPDRPAEWFTGLYEEPDVDDEVTRAQLHDLATYLPDDLLIKSDMASMASSLELRCPMLGHDLVDLGLSLPLELKIHRGFGKVALRQAFGNLLPQEALRRSKKGFGVPLDTWLRSDLLETMRETLFDKAFQDARIVQPEAVAGLVNDHLSGRGDHRHQLWALLVLARWFVKARPS